MDITEHSYIQKFSFKDLGISQFVNTIDRRQKKYTRLNRFHNPRITIKPAISPRRNLFDTAKIEKSVFSGGSAQSLRRRVDAMRKTAIQKL